MLVSYDPALKRPYLGASSPKPAFVLHGEGLPRPVDPLSSKLMAIPGARRAGGNKSAPEGFIAFPAHPLAAQRLLELLPRVAGTGVEWTPGVELIAAAIADRPRMKGMALAGADGRALARVPLRALREHQLQALAAIKALGFRALLADDMGLGKTAVAIEAYLAWCEQARRSKLTVVCPVSVKWNWVNELGMQGIDNDQVLVVDGTPKQRANQCVLIPHKQVVIINYDLLRFLNEPQLEALHQHVRDAFLVCDEGHYIKDRTSRRTRIVTSLGTEARNDGKEPAAVLMISGTPIRSTPADLYTQITMLCDVWTNWYEFQDRYLVLGDLQLTGGRKKKIVVGTKNDKELNAIVDCYQIRRMKTDVGNLPPKIVSKHTLHLDEETRAIYAAMKRFWLYSFGDLPDDEDVFSERARTALEQAMRLEQIAQGFVGGLPEEVTERVADVLNDCGAVSLKGRPKELVFPKSAKLLWTLERIDDLLLSGRPVVLWSRFNAPLYWLEVQLAKRGSKPTMLHGGLTSLEKQSVIEGFQKGESDVFLGQVKMAEGFNLVRATDVIMFGRDWSHAINLQAEDRCHRIGQKGTVNVEIPLCADTCEIYLDQKLTAKENTANTILAVRKMRDLKELINS